MVDFTKNTLICTVCGGDDINIEELYNTSYKTIPDLKNIIKSLKDEEFFSSELGNNRVCARCAMNGMGINNKFELIAGYRRSQDTVKIGKIDKRNMKLKMLDVSDVDHYKNLNDIEEIVKPIEVPKLTKSEIDVRNTIESLLDFSNEEIKKVYENWKEHDMTNLGLSIILTHQLKKEQEQKEKEKNALKIENVEGKAVKSVKDVLKEK